MLANIRRHVCIDHYLPVDSKEWVYLGYAEWDARPPLGAAVEVHPMDGTGRTMRGVVCEIDPDKYRYRIRITRG